MIIDCHCHAGKGDGLTGPWDTDATLDLYLKRAERAGIERTVLFAAFHSDYAIANREGGQDRGQPAGSLLRLCLCPLAMIAAVSATWCESRSSSMALSESKFTATTPASRGSLRSRARLRLPVLYDPIGEVSIAELLANGYPDVDFIIPHLGSFSDDWRAQQAFIDPLARHPNISHRHLRQCAASICWSRR